MRILGIYHHLIYAKHVGRQLCKVLATTIIIHEPKDKGFDNLPYQATMSII